MLPPAPPATLRRMFSWIPLYEEIARKVLEFESDQPTLIALLKRLEAKGLKVISILDEDANAVKFPLEEIDPFTFFASFNRSTTNANRCGVLAALKSQLQLTAEVPAVIDGIPLLTPQNAWFFAYAPSRGTDDVRKLWALARETVGRTRENFPRSVFNSALTVKRCGLAKLTMGMFWLNPRAFLAAEAHNVASAKRAGIAPPEDSADGYFSWLDQVVEKVGDDLPTISRKAYEPESVLLHESEPLNETDTSKSRDRKARLMPAGFAFWTIQAGVKGQQWDDFREHGLIAVGFPGVGDFRSYSSRQEIRRKLLELSPRDSVPEMEDSRVNARLAAWQFSREMKPGDIVFASRGIRRLLGCGRIVSDYIFDEQRPEYPHLRRVEWLSVGDWEIPDSNLTAVKTLTRVTGEDFINVRLALAGLDPKTLAQSLPMPRWDRYTKADALADLFADESEFDTMLARLRRKKNLVLTGPPGVGKTFVAKRLAFAAMGERDESRVAMVQFHQSYSYEDFIQGFRPRDGGGFQRKSGVFHDFACRAQRDLGRDYFFIIDEINRGNLSKIFGELMMLLEADKRGAEHALPLTYAESSSDTFYLPPNLYLIGTMNTADRSLALVDYALRRRFAFFDLEPKFASERFADWLRRAGATDALVEKIQRGVAALNGHIADAPDLGRGFCIGHSYFCPINGSVPDDAWLQEVIEAEIRPLLEEYFDKPAATRELLDKAFS